MEAGLEGRGGRGGWGETSGLQSPEHVSETIIRSEVVVPKGGFLASGAAAAPGSLLEMQVCRLYLSLIQTH